ncbi:MAG: TIGR01777 family oxidoreductase [Isosphaeraceae bacterium]|nr:TIGR01777 family oxidoreductase [Isosphaeraceae bacterium]
MRVFITGGTGLIGRRLTQRLIERGDAPVILSRRSDEVRRNKSMRGISVVQGDPTVAGSGWEEHVEGCDAVVNLAGHNLFANRWSTTVKRTIRDSRVLATENLVKAVRDSVQKPGVFVQGSAIGFYGAHGDEELNEDSPCGSDFMARICREWEDAAKPAEGLGARLAIVRTGVVLAAGEGALGVMTPIFKWLPGGAAPVGSGEKATSPASGKQWMSWIHLDDIVGIILLALDNAEARGPINGTAPNPARNVDFGKALAKVLKRPFVPVGPPDVMMRTILGEVADVVIKGQKVLPAKALALGYRFAYPELLEALRSALAPPPKPKPEPKPAHGHGHDKAHAHH